MKSWACKWSDGISVCFADTIEDATWKFDMLGQPFKIYEIDLSDIVLDQIELKGGQVKNIRITRIGLGTKLLKKTFSYKQTFNSLKRTFYN